MRWPHRYKESILSLYRWLARDLWLTQDIRVDILKNDCEEYELRTLMMDRKGWKAIARSGRVRTRLQ